MNVIDMILSSQNGGQIQQLARNFGLDEAQVQSAIGQIVPALSHGVKKNITSESGLASLSKALENGSHQRYLEQSESLTGDQAVSDGNNILGHILGSKDVSRAVADRASVSTGLESGVLKKMLPVVASMMMGSLSKQASSSGILGERSSTDDSSGGMLDMLGGMLDADNDGSAADDLLGMASKLFR
ncbi:MAG: DUF937 domain-containing protein [Gammaproteobacteria bacterium]|nr:DUF937 domain-containing protein [Gammaproteobacteria bacterium]